MPRRAEGGPPRAPSFSGRRPARWPPGDPPARAVLSARPVPSQPRQLVAPKRESAELPTTALANAASPGYVEAMRCAPMVKLVFWGDVPLSRGRRDEPRGSPARAGPTGQRPLAPVGRPRRAPQHPPGLAPQALLRRPAEPPHPVLGRGRRPGRGAASHLGDRAG